ncbi:hypothetical protein VOLCADRAFT_106561 [Volvox carteri f. nagariensis]|uniref:Class II aldolase/adducin N-terminal domain-containing protein n=1 Tax=Volvox carteri f. nagariensis TaxID=3068 RepID=D8U869_VOLCA|nr:uncharacterized protein VOLCADRAFT_106561 [Volvox carteri f. nagariensis]EFJ44037.1 hypothetical protein VOLCADRAFT_106561 [Volvox carteri f. nagariensis]|eukprot:XP_002954838.1 hypothetical protein VOLCADRAFT_106561 [Volvox carteri f. nagariensis]
MTELITEDRPRIKFTTRFVGKLVCLTDAHTELHSLSRLMSRMEALGAAPILNDGQVAGNCAINPQILHRHGATEMSSASAQSGDSPTQGPPGLALVSMSGKPPGHALDPNKDFVLVTAFDRISWAAEYRSREPSIRPSSDTPLLTAALARGVDYGWQDTPLVVLHGHALAEGEGLSYAAELGLPVSSHETLFSTPEDLSELEALFRLHPYPQNRCYIRRGHGFFLLSKTVAEAEEWFAKWVQPWLLARQTPAPAPAPCQANEAAGGT